MSSEILSLDNADLLKSLDVGKGTLRRGMLLFCLISALIALPLLFFMESDYRDYVSKIEGKDQRQLERMALQAKADLKVLVSDVSQLAEFVSKGLDRYKTDKEWIAQEFMQFAKYRQRYDQLRFINDSGDEQVRIDWKDDRAVLLSPDMLQNKAHRYYFSNTLQLEQNQVYLSAIDFNRDFGEVTLPQKTTLRISSPVISSDQRVSGIVVINFLLNHILSVDGDYSEGSGRLQIVDALGESLIREAHIPILDMRSDAVYNEVLNRARHSEHLVHVYQAGNRLITILHTNFAFMGRSDKGGYPEWFLIKETELPSRLDVWLRDRANILLYGSFIALLLSAGLAWLITVHRNDYLARKALRTLAYSCIQQSPSAIIIADSQRRIVYVNEFFTELTGYAYSEIRGKTPDFLQSGETPETQYTALWSTLDRGQVWHGEFINRKANGDLFWCKAAMSQLHYGDQQKLYICIESDISQLKESERKLRYLASHDPLTRLGNRDYLLAEFSALPKDSGRIGCLMLDIDHFKRINDQYGHQVGDDVIKTVAEHIAKHARQTDISVRYGGEEFVLILPGASAEQVMVIAERLRKTIGEMRLVINQQTIQVTISIGCTIRDADALCSKSSDIFLHEADVALYYAKNNGRNQVALYSPEMEDVGKESLPCND